MKIVHVLPTLAPGGMEHLALQLAADAVGHGDPVLVAAGPGAWAGQVAARCGACRAARDLTRLRHRPNRGGGSAGRLPQAARPHVVHAHNVRAAVLAGWR